MSKTTTKNKEKDKKVSRPRLPIPLNYIDAPWLESLNESKLTMKRELFCQYFTGGEETYGNAVFAYAAAYNYDLDALSVDDALWSDEERDEDDRIVVKAECIRKSSYDRAYHACGVNGHRLLKNPKIAERITKLRNEKILNDERVDSELAGWIANKREPATSLGAIKEYNKLRKRTDEAAPVVIVVNNTDALTRVYGGVPA